MEQSEIEEECFIFKTNKKTERQMVGGGVWRGLWCVLSFTGKLPVFPQKKSTGNKFGPNTPKLKICIFFNTSTNPDNKAIINYQPKQGSVQILMKKHPVYLRKLVTEKCTFSLQDMISESGMLKFSESDAI